MPNDATVGPLARQYQPVDIRGPTAQIYASDVRTSFAAIHLYERYRRYGLAPIVARASRQSSVLLTPERVRGVD